MSPDLPLAVMPVPGIINAANGREIGVARPVGLREGKIFLTGLRPLVLQVVVAFVNPRIAAFRGGLA